MDKAGSNRLLSQQGFSSIDFTLLDRPSDSVMPASGSPKHIYTGAPSLQSTDYFNGARTDPLTNQSYPEHGSSYMLAAQKSNAMKDLYERMQRHGVHDFFGQDPDQQLGTFSESNHPHYSLSPSPSGNDQGVHSHSLSLMSEGGSMEIRKFPNDPIHMPIMGPIQDRNHQFSDNPQRIYSHLQNTQVRLRNPMPMTNGLSSSPNSSLKDLTGESFVQHQNQNGRYSPPPHAGDGFLNDAKSQELFENQIRWKGPSPAPCPWPSPSPAQAGLGQGQISTRASGMTKLQLLQKHALQVKKQQALEAQKQQAQKQHVLEAHDLEVRKIQVQQQDDSLGHATEAQHHHRDLHGQQGFKSSDDLFSQAQPQQQLDFQSQNDQILRIQSHEQGFWPQNAQSGFGVQQQGYQSESGKLLRTKQSQYEAFQSQNDQAMLRSQQQGFQSVNDQLLFAQQQQEDFQSQFDHSLLQNQQQRFRSQIDQSLQAQHQQGSQAQTNQAMLRAQQSFHFQNAQSLQAQQSGLLSQNYRSSGLQLQHQQGLQSQNDSSLRGHLQQSQRELFLKAQQQDQSFQFQSDQSLQTRQGFQSQNGQSLWVQHQQRGVQSQSNQNSRQQQGFQSQIIQPSREHQPQDIYQFQNAQLLQNRQGFQTRNESQQQQQDFQFSYEHSLQAQHQPQGDQSLKAQQQNQFENEQSFRPQEQRYQFQSEQALRGQQVQSFEPRQHDIRQVQQTQILQAQDQLKKQHIVELQQQASQNKQQISMQTYQEPTLPSRVQLPVQPLQQHSTQSQQHLALQSQPQYQVLTQLKQSHIVPEPHLEFPETSYSALLHRPDTPPSQSQVADETQVPESDRDLSFPDVNMSAVDAASYYQELPNNASMDRNPNFALRTFSDTPTMKQVGPVNAQTYLSEAHAVPTERANVGWTPFSNDLHRGKPMVCGGYPENVQTYETQTKISVGGTVINDELNGNSTFFAAQQLQSHKDVLELPTDGLGVKHFSNNENRNQSQMHLKLLAAQQPQQLRENSALRTAVHDPMCIVNPLSQSQKHFQTLQLNQERSPSPLQQRKTGSNPNFSRLGDSVFQSTVNYGNNGRGWSNSSLPQACSFSSVHSQAETEDIQSPVDMPSPSRAMTRSHMMPGQEILRSRLESGLAVCNSVVASGLTKSPPFGPGGLPLEKNNAPNNLTDVGKPRDESSNNHSNDLWHSNEGKAAFGSDTSIRSLNSGNGQGMAGHQVHGKQLPIMNGMNQETQGQAANQPSTNVLKVPVGKQTGKMVSNVIEDSPALLHKSSSGHTIEALQQNIDSSVSGIALTQGWKTQSSHPTSPQHVKLALGPTNLSQISQQAVKPSWSNLNHIQDVVEGVSTSHSVGGSLHADMPYGSSAIGGTSDHQIESHQVSDAVGKRSLFQSGSAADMSNKWTLSKESTPSEVLPLKFASFGHGLHTKPVITSPGMKPSSRTSVEGDECSQREVRVGVGSFPGFQQACNDDSRTTASLIGQTPSTSDLPRQPNYDSSSFHEMHNQHIINMALRQLENRGQAGNAIGSATNLKIPPPDQPNSSPLLGSLPVVKAREISDDGSKRGTIQMFQQTGNLGLVSTEGSSALKLNTESRNNQFRLSYQEKASAFQTSGLATTSSIPSDVDNGSSNSQAQGEPLLYGQHNLQFPPLQVDLMARKFENSQSLDQLRAKTSNGTLADPAELPLRRKDMLVKAGSIPTNFVYAGKASLNQQTGIHSMGVGQHRSMLELNEVTQNSAEPEEQVKCAPQRLLKQPMENTVGSTSPSLYKDKDEDAVPTDAYQTQGYTDYDRLLSRDAKIVSEAHHGKPTDLSLQAQAFKYGTSNLYGTTLNSVHHISTNEHIPVESREKANEIYGTKIIASSQLSFKTSYETATLVHPKKNKQVPLLIPWHLTATQPPNNLLSSGEAELSWASATNRLPDKENMDVHGDMSDEARAKKRLKLTTQLMQQIFSPFSIFGNNTHLDNECTIYSATKLALVDACKLAERESGSANSCSDAGKSHTRSRASMTKAVQFIESLMERVKRLDDEIRRSERMVTAMELKAETHELERISIVNRLVMQHGIGFALDPSSLPSSSSHLLIGNNRISDTGRRLYPHPMPTPEKYVTVTPMPRTLPDHAKCLSL